MAIDFSKGPVDFDKILAQVKEANARQQAAQRQMPVDRSGQREMSGLDRFFSGANKLGEGISDIWGFGEDYSKLKEDYSRGDYDLGDTLRTAAKFVGNLPGQIVGAVPIGLSELYEAASGNPIREGEDGWMPDYKLSGAQRLADVADAAVNIGGIALGGSGSAVRAGKAILGGEQSIKAAVKAGKLWDAKTLGGRMAADASEEAGEEFAQSMFEDIRGDAEHREGKLSDKWFDKATEAAMLGAAGGAIMGGGSWALAGAIDSTDSKSPKFLKAPVATTQNNDNRIDFDTSEEHIIDEAARTLEEENSKMNQFGSSTYARGVHSVRTGLDGFKLGLRNFVEIVEREAMEQVAQNRFLTNKLSGFRLSPAFTAAHTEFANVPDVTTMFRLINGSDRNTQYEFTQELNNYIAQSKAAGEQWDFAVFKNPAGNLGALKLKFEGIGGLSRALYCSQLTSNQMGADFDSDNYTAVLMESWNSSDAGGRGGVAPRDFQYSIETIGEQGGRRGKVAKDFLTHLGITDNQAFVSGLNEIIQHAGNQDIRSILPDAAAVEDAFINEPQDGAISYDKYGVTYVNELLVKIFNNIDPSRADRIPFIANTPAYINAHNLLATSNATPRQQAFDLLNSLVNHASGRLESTGENRLQAEFNAIVENDNTMAARLNMLDENGIYSIQGRTSSSAAVTVMQRMFGYFDSPARAFTREGQIMKLMLKDSIDRVEVQYGIQESRVGLLEKVLMDIARLDERGGHKEKLVTSIARELVYESTMASLANGRIDGTTDLNQFIENFKKAYSDVKKQWDSATQKTINGNKIDSALTALLPPISEGTNMWEQIGNIFFERPIISWCSEDMARTLFGDIRDSSLHQWLDSQAAFYSSARDSREVATRIKNSISGLSTQSTATQDFVLNLFDSIVGKRWKASKRYADNNRTFIEAGSTQRLLAAVDDAVESGRPLPEALSDTQFAQLFDYCSYMYGKLGKKVLYNLGVMSDMDLVYGTTGKEEVRTPLSPAMAKKLRSRNSSLSLAAQIQVTLLSNTRDLRRHLLNRTLDQCARCTRVVEDLTKLEKISPFYHAMAGKLSQELGLDVEQTHIDDEAANRAVQILDSLTDSSLTLDNLQGLFLGYFNYGNKEDINDSPLLADVLATEDDGLSMSSLDTREREAHLFSDNVGKFDTQTCRAKADRLIDLDNNAIISVVRRIGLEVEAVSQMQDKNALTSLVFNSKVIRPEDESKTVSIAANTAIISSNTIREAGWMLSESDNLFQNTGGHISTQVLLNNPVFVQRMFFTNFIDENGGIDLANRAGKTWHIKTRDEFISLLIGQQFNGTWDKAAVQAIRNNAPWLINIFDVMSTQYSEREDGSIVQSSSTVSDLESFIKSAGENLSSATDNNRQLSPQDFEIRMRNTITTGLFSSKEGIQTFLALTKDIDTSRGWDYVSDQIDGIIDDLMKVAVWRALNDGNAAFDTMSARLNQQVAQEMENRAISASLSADAFRRLNVSGTETDDALAEIYQMVLRGEFEETLRTSLRDQIETMRDEIRQLRAYWGTTQNVNAAQGLQRGQFSDYLASMGYLPNSFRTTQGIVGVQTPVPQSVAAANSNRAATIDAFYDSQFENGLTQKEWLILFADIVNAVQRGEDLVQRTAPYAFDNFVHELEDEITRITGTQDWANNDDNVATVILYQNYIDTYNNPANNTRSNPFVPLLAIPNGILENDMLRFGVFDEIIGIFNSAGTQTAQGQGNQASQTQFARIVNNGVYARQYDAIRMAGNLIEAILRCTDLNENFTYDNSTSHGSTFNGSIKDAIYFWYSTFVQPFANPLNAKDSWLSGYFGRRSVVSDTDENGFAYQFANSGRYDVVRTILSVAWQEISSEIEGTNKLEEPDVHGSNLLAQNYMKCVNQLSEAINRMGIPNMGNLMSANGKTLGVDLPTLPSFSLNYGEIGNLALQYQRLMAGGVDLRTSMNAGERPLYAVFSDMEDDMEMGSTWIGSADEAKRAYDIIKSNLSGFTPQGVWKDKSMTSFKRITEADIQSWDNVQDDIEVIANFKNGSGFDIRSEKISVTGNTYFNAFKSIFVHLTADTTEALALLTAKDPSGMSKASFSNINRESIRNFKELLSFKTPRGGIQASTAFDSIENLIWYLREQKTEYASIAHDLNMTAKQSEGREKAIDLDDTDYYTLADYCMQFIEFTVRENAQNGATSTFVVRVPVAALIAAGRDVNGRTDPRGILNVINQFVPAGRRADSIDIDNCRTIVFDPKTLATQMSHGISEAISSDQNVGDVLYQDTEYKQRYVTPWIQRMRSGQENGNLFFDTAEEFGNDFRHELAFMRPQKRFSGSSFITESFGTKNAWNVIMQRRRTLQKSLKPLTAEVNNTIDKIRESSPEANTQMGAFRPIRVFAGEDNTTFRALQNSVVNEYDKYRIIYDRNDLVVFTDGGNREEAIDYILEHGNLDPTSYGGLRFVAVREGIKNSIADNDVFKKVAQVVQRNMSIGNQPGEYTLYAIQPTPLFFSDRSDTCSVVWNAPEKYKGLVFSTKEDLPVGDGAVYAQSVPEIRIEYDNVVNTISGAERKGDATVQEVRTLCSGFANANLDEGEFFNSLNIHRIDVSGILRESDKLSALKDFLIHYPTSTTNFLNNLNANEAALAQNWETNSTAGPAVVGFYKVWKNGVEWYVPIIGNVMHGGNATVVQLGNGQYEISGIGTINAEDIQYGSSFKIHFPEVALKLMLGAYEFEENWNYSFGDGRSGNKIEYVGGKEYNEGKSNALVNRRLDYWVEMRKFGLGILWQRDAQGNMELKPGIVDTSNHEVMAFVRHLTSGNVTAQELNNFISPLNNSFAFDFVAYFEQNGRTTQEAQVLSDRLNSILKVIARNSIRFNFNFKDAIMSPDYEVDASGMLISNPRPNPNAAEELSLVYSGVSEEDFALLFHAISAQDFDTQDGFMESHGYTPTWNKSAERLINFKGKNQYRSFHYVTERNEGTSTDTDYSNNDTSVGQKITFMTSMSQGTKALGGNQLKNQRLEYLNHYRITPRTTALSSRAAQRRKQSMNRDSKEYAFAEFDQRVEGIPTTSEMSNVLRYRSAREQERLISQQHNHGSLLLQKGQKSYSLRSADSQLGGIVQSLDMLAKNTWSEELLWEIVYKRLGKTWNGGTGAVDVTVEQARGALQDAFEMLNSGRLTVVGEGKNNKLMGYDRTGEYRCQIPVLSEAMVTFLVENFGADRNNIYADMRSLCDEVVENIGLAKAPVNRTTEIRNAMLAYSQGIRGFENFTAGFVMGDYSMSALIDTFKSLGYNIAGSDSEIFENVADIMEQNLQDITQRHAEHAQRNATKVVKNPTVENGLTVYRSGTPDNTTRGLVNGMTGLSRMMATFQPILPGANIIDRVSRGGVINAMLWAGAKDKFSPFANNFEDYMSQEQIDQMMEAINMASNDKTVRKIVASLRMISVLSDEGYSLDMLQNINDVESWLAEHSRDNGRFEQFYRQYMDIATGKDWGNQIQVRILLKNLARVISLNPELAQVYFMVDPETNATYFQQRLAPGNVARFVAEIAAGNNALAPEFRQSWNLAMRGDTAEKTCLSILLSEFCSQHPVFNLFQTSILCRFPQYAINVANRALNTVFPMTALNYIIAKYGSEDNAFSAIRIPGLHGMTVKMLHFEDSQVAASFREAIAMDLATMGTMAVAMILFSLTGALEPPPDEDKWGNIDEWMLFGNRITINWWLKDVVGPALGYAAFWKSCALGKPRLDVLMNDMMSCMYSNPVLQASQIVETLIDPGKQYREAWANDVERFRNAAGESPDASMVLWANASSSIINWGMQFITPSFLKELYQASQEYEVSYKKIAMTDAYGNVILKSDGTPYYMNTTYLDAKIRYLAKKNPVFAFLADIFTGKGLGSNETGYLASEMPRTVYYDPTQLDAFKALSLYYDDGFGNQIEKSEKEKQAIALGVIMKLQSYSDMEELYKTGFCIPRETMDYVGDVIWDIIQGQTDIYQTMMNTGQLDYYLLGDGDYEKGKQVAKVIAEQYEDTYSYWSDLYYNKLWSDAMKRGLVRYNRYNTTYEQDANGDWYATGYRRGPMLSVLAPYRVAPMSGTMGYENDWATQSVVTGESMGERALTPVPDTNVKTPSLESHSGNGSGSGYSPSYGKYSKAYPSYSGWNPPTLYTPNTWATRYSGPSDAYGYNRPVTGVQLDVNRLYPQFETKGSRMAYRREDI